MAKVKLVYIDFLQLLLQFLYSIYFAVLFGYQLRGELASMQISIVVLSVILQFGGGGFYLRSRHSFSNIERLQVGIFLYLILSIFLSLFFLVFFSLKLIEYENLLILSGSIYVTISSLLQVHYRLNAATYLYFFVTCLRLFSYLSILLLFHVLTAIFNHDWFLSGKYSIFYVFILIDAMIILFMLIVSSRSMRIPRLWTIKGFISFGLEFFPHKVMKTVSAELDAILVMIISDTAQLGQFSVVKSIYKGVPALGRIINNRQTILLSNLYSNEINEGNKVLSLAKILKLYLMGSSIVIVLGFFILFSQEALVSIFQINYVFAFYLVALAPLTILYYPLYNLVFYEQKLLASTLKPTGVVITLIICLAMYVIGYTYLELYLKVLLVAEALMCIVLFTSERKLLGKPSQFVVSASLAYVLILVALI